MGARLAGLLDLLDLESLGNDCFHGASEQHLHGRIFGGQVAAQALVAAARTVEGRHPHALHGFFLRRGDPQVPIQYRVRRLLDGRSFSNREVVAAQGDDVLLQMAVSFQLEQHGYEHQAAMPEVPDPETLLTLEQQVERMRGRFPADTQDWAANPRAVDMRHVKVPSYLGGEASDGPNYAWFRADGPVGDDPLIHQALLTYATDLSFNDNAIRPHGRDGPLGSQVMSSLDHSLWLHRAVRTDEWLLFAQDSPAAGGGRGFVTGQIFDRAGRLVASAAQESLMRPRDPLAR
jgi:acyl-CoA thioesterase-2